MLMLYSMNLLPIYRAIKLRFAGDIYFTKDVLTSVLLSKGHILFYLYNLLNFLSSFVHLG